MPPLDNTVQGKDLCINCSTFFSKKPVTPSHEVNHESVPDVREILDVLETAAEGCSFCALVAQRLQCGDKGTSTSSTEKLRLSIDDTYDGEIKDGRLLRVEVGKSGNYLLSFRLYSPRSLEPPSDRVVRDTNDSEESKALICKWYDICDTEHAECRPSDASTKYWKPTRLLKIEPSKESEAEVCKLVNGSQVAREKGYVALSYCWGEIRFLKLESRNEHELRKGILVSSLEETFQHALKVTRWLGYKYIWIDCLCINQYEDNKGDWQNEAPTMKSVYSAASITIVAAHGKDPSSGLFTRRYAKSIVPPVVHCPWADYLNPTLTITFNSLWSYEIDCGSLASRAWTVQERALSRRLLIFGISQVFYKCSKMNLCESYPDSEPPSTVNSTSLALFQLSDQVPSSGEAWSRMVEMYSGAKLTRDEDKLMAFAGLAEKMQERFPEDDYVVGFWGINQTQTHRATELLWTTWGGKAATCRLSPRVAPTWSWLSLNARVWLRNPEEDIEKVLIDILEVCVTPVDAKHPTGNIHGDPRLHIQCKLKPAEWYFVGGTADDHLGTYQITFDGIARDRSYISGVTLVGGVRLDGPISKDLANLKIFLLPVARCLCWRRKTIAGLVVTPAHDQKGRYQRLGCFNMEKKHGRRLTHERFIQRTSSLDNEGSKTTNIKVIKRGWQEIPDQFIYLV